MWKWRLRATNYACKRGLVVRFSPLKDLARTRESEEFLLLESGIREIFFCNPESWNPEYSSNKKFTLKSWIHMQAPLTKSLRSRIHGVESKKPRLSWIPLHGPRPVADPGEGPGGPAPLIFRPPTYLRVWMTGASLLWRSLSASGDFSSQKSVLNLVNFEMFNSL